MTLTLSMPNYGPSMAEAGVRPLIQYASRNDADSSSETVAAINSLLEDAAKSYCVIESQICEKIKERWKQLCAEGWAGKTEEVHALRAPIAEMIASKRQSMAKVRELVDLLQRRTGVRLSERTLLDQAEQFVDQFQNDVLDRWHSLEDLEDMLAASYPLSNDRLKAMASKHAPPASWFDEQSNPF